jgi:UPF0271 protein
VQKKIIVLDTSAFIAGFDPFSISEEEYTVPLVKDEISEKSPSYLRLEAAEENGKVKVRTPEQHFIASVENCAISVGDSFLLSETDTQLLALALELKAEGHNPIIATDDYSIQNVASKLDIRSTPMITLGIRNCLQWMRYCPACYNKYSSNYNSETCEICGTRLKRKPLRSGKITTDR